MTESERDVRLRQCSTRLRGYMHSENMAAQAGEVQPAHGLCFTLYFLAPISHHAVLLG